MDQPSNVSGFFVYVRVCVHVCVCTYTCFLVVVKMSEHPLSTRKQNHTNTQTDTHRQTHTHTHTHTHKHTQTHTHTHKQSHTHTLLVLRLEFVPPDKNRKQTGLSSGTVSLARPGTSATATSTEYCQCAEQQLVPFAFATFVFTTSLITPLVTACAHAVKKRIDVTYGDVPFEFEVQTFALLLFPKGSTVCMGMQERGRERGRG